MNKLAVFSLSALCAMLFALCSHADPGTYLDQRAYSLTTNAASRTIVVTNFPAAGSATYEWYPASILLANRGAATGELLRVEHLITGTTNIMRTNGTFTLTNTLVSLNSASGVDTNWAPTVRWYIAPSAGQLRISTVVTNGELILNRETGR